MKSLAVFLTVCLGIAAAGVLKKRQVAVPPAPTAPPKPNPTTTDGPAMPTVTVAVTSAGGNDSTTPMVPDATTDDSTVGMGTTTAKMEEVTTTEMKTTTKKPTIEEIVSVDEIVEKFREVSNTTFFKKLPIEKQVIVLEILAGGETARMTPVLEQMETKKLLSFLYNLPFKYSDSLWRLIDLGYTREEIIG